MLVVLCALLGALCSVASAQAQADTVRRDYIAADVRFMQQMIGHHAQALVMAALVPARTGNPEVRLLAEKIDVSQQDEIASMRRWLTARGQPLPDPAAHSHEPMPGMLAPEELDQLRAARGPAFDRLFLTYMIRHHEGALTMAARLFAAPGAAQEPELAGFATDVDADQRAEIRRMRAILAKTP